MHGILQPASGDGVFLRSTCQPSLLGLLRQRLAAADELLERLAQALLSLAVPDLVPAAAAAADLAYLPSITSFAEHAPRHIREASMECPMAGTELSSAATHEHCLVPVPSSSGPGAGNSVLPHSFVQIY